ncbi:MAG TPA: sigma-54-dependent Fis family transcriptional regulator, partial [Bacteroidetes bacterium]|nr:sigma-54-dependent Fis family transcriptional regulator [Bacteroidota bacterium]
MVPRILVVDDDEILRATLTTILTRRGFEVDSVADGLEALDAIRSKVYDLVVTDIEMPRMNGITLLDRASALNPRLSFIVITAYASVESAVEALRRGAYDYLLKPLNFDDLILKIQRLLEHRQLVLENQYLRQEIHQRYTFENLVGQSEAMQKVFRLIEKVSKTESNVLITGRSGTGKELVARAIHFTSNRRHQPLISINCAALTESVVESELFGYRRGAFTGATTHRDGLFVAASGGTLFLDEVGDLPASVQPKLLRAIEQREIVPVGGTKPVPVDVRIIAATHRNLRDEVEAGRFRADLFYRLNVVEIHLPSLSERPEDIPLLVKHFISQFNRQMNKSVRGATPEALDLLTRHCWRGEVRELQNAIERAMIFCQDDYLDIQHLPAEIWE